MIWHRRHGATRTYWSSCEDAWLQTRASGLRRWAAGVDCWGIFDNTASGAATLNATAFVALMQRR